MLDACVWATPHRLPYWALIAARRRWFTRTPSSTAVIWAPNVLFAKLAPPELLKRYLVMPLAPATDRISCTNWLAIHAVFAGSAGGAKFTPIMLQMAPVLRIPFSMTGKF